MISDIYDISDIVWYYLDNSQRGLRELSLVSAYGARYIFGFSMKSDKKLAYGISIKAGKPLRTEKVSDRWLDLLGERQLVRLAAAVCRRNTSERRPFGGTAACAARTHNLQRQDEPFTWRRVVDRESDVCADGRICNRLGLQINIGDWRLQRKNWTALAPRPAKFKRGAFKHGRNRRELARSSAISLALISLYDETVELE